MIFADHSYLLYLAAAVAGFFLLPVRFREWWLAGSGILFYAYYATGFLWLIVAECALLWLLLPGIRRNKRVFIGVVALLVGVLAFFKYQGVGHGLVAQVAGPLALGAGGLPDPDAIALPLAISFFTFEFIHYVVDARRGSIPVHRLRDFLAFAAFFPTMVSGPIKRFQSFVPQISKAVFSWVNLYEGGVRITIGLVKKLIVADSMAPMTEVFASDESVAEADPWQIALGLLAYSIRIYFDFSGYSDIAIGSARIFGIGVPENFARPYLATNITMFWRRWHMSLTQWIIDYIYVPLGGSRVKMGRSLLNILIAMTASGLWHGAGLGFLLWAWYHAALLMIHRLWGIWRGRTRGQDRAVALDAEVGVDADIEAGARAGTETEDTSRGMGGSVRRGTVRAVSVTTTFILVTLGWGLFFLPPERFISALRILGLPL